MAKLAMGELEGRVMNVVWDQGGWLTPGEVHEIVSRTHPLAYTTVMTILVRLWQKGALERERDGRAYAYHATESREERSARRMSELLATAGDPTLALSHFVRVLSKRERAQLGRLLKAELR